MDLMFLLKICGIILAGWLFFKFCRKWHEYTH